jgi:hypothetical protein
LRHICTHAGNQIILHRFFFHFLVEVAKIKMSSNLENENLWVNERHNVGLQK